jgi:hypothetical protein
MIYARFMFTSRLQKPGEPFNNFLMDIKKLVRDCAYADEDIEEVVFKIKSFS